MKYAVLPIHKLRWTTRPNLVHILLKIRAVKMREKWLIHCQFSSTLTCKTAWTELKSPQLTMTNAHPTMFAFSEFSYPFNSHHSSPFFSGTSYPLWSASWLSIGVLWKSPTSTGGIITIPPLFHSCYDDIIQKPSNKMASVTYTTVTNIDISSFLQTIVNFV